MKRIQTYRYALGLWTFRLLLYSSVIEGVLAVPLNDCCKNGGVCMFKSFCVCSPEFYGRHCEYRLLKKGCSKRIKHGTWLRSDCDLCWCFNGTFRCQLQVFRGCDDSRRNYVLETEEHALDDRRDIYIYPSLSNVSNTLRYFTDSRVFILSMIALIGFS